MSVYSILLMKLYFVIEEDMVGSVYWCDWDRSEWPDILTVGVVDEERGLDCGWLIERSIGRLTKKDQLMIQYV